MSRDTFDELRQSFDGSESFMVRGHGIKTMRRGQRTVPDWAKDKRKLQALLLRSFPKMMTNTRQRAGAGRWARVIYLFYNLNLTSGQIAKELEITVKHVDVLLVGIRRVARGLRYDGRGKLGQRLVGRPKKLT
jgi:hypothetical protein